MWTEAGIYVRCPLLSMAPRYQWGKTFFPIVSASIPTGGFNNTLSIRMTLSSSWSYNLYLVNNPSQLGK